MGAHKFSLLSQTFEGAYMQTNTDALDDINFPKSYHTTERGLGYRDCATAAAAGLR